jgi:hypothetical protein
MIELIDATGPRQDHRAAAMSASMPATDDGIAMTALHA